MARSKVSMWQCLGWLLAAILNLPCCGAQELPAEIRQAFERFQVPLTSVSVWVEPLGQPGLPLIQHRVDAPMNPASVVKLLTTAAAIDLLGPDFTWKTRVFIDGEINQGRLKGNLYIKGSGDPRLRIEQLELMLKKLKGLGVVTIDGNIYIDRSSFDMAESSGPASFDGESLRPYNAKPDAFLLHFKSLIFNFLPEEQGQWAGVHIEPPVWGLNMQKSIPIRAGDCENYRALLKPDFTSPLEPKFNGFFPKGCGEKLWPVAFADPATFSARVLQGAWAEIGGQLTGSVLESKVPASLQPVITWESEPLGVVIRDINKFSNNLMAEQLFLTLSLEKNGLGNQAASRLLLEAWAAEKLGMNAPVLENGSGLSRQTRLSARMVAAVLQYMWKSPWMPEWYSSLPVNGQSGTLKRAQLASAAHLKTGSLQNAVSIAGYVEGINNQRWLLVVMVNHEKANAARPALELLINWLQKKTTSPSSIYQPR